jgi:hypothetical protein
MTQSTYVVRHLLLVFKTMFFGLGIGKNSVTHLTSSYTVGTSIEVSLHFSYEGSFRAGLPDFSRSKHTKTGKNIYQMVEKYSKRSYNI